MCVCTAYLFLFGSTKWCQPVSVHTHVGCQVPPSGLHCMWGMYHTKRWSKARYICTYLNWEFVGYCTVLWGLHCLLATWRVNPDRHTDCHTVQWVHTDGQTDRHTGWHTVHTDRQTDWRMACTHRLAYGMYTQTDRQTDTQVNMQADTGTETQADTPAGHAPVGEEASSAWATKCATAPTPAHLVSHGSSMCRIPCTHPCLQTPSGHICLLSHERWCNIPHRCVLP